jgi:ligand-binding sensor protein
MRIDISGVGEIPEDERVTPTPLQRIMMSTPQSIPMIQAMSPEAPAAPAPAPIMNSVPPVLTEQAMQNGSQGILDMFGFKTDNLGNRLANAFIAAGSQNPMEAIAKLQAGDAAEVERIRKAKQEQEQLKQSARKLTLEELKANKPTIQSSGVPGFSIAIYPDGRVESIVNDAAVEAYNRSEEAKNQRQQDLFNQQNQLLDKRLQSSERIAADRQAAADRKGTKLNPSLQKEEDADFTTIDGAKAAAADIQPVIDNLTSGKLQLGALQNAFNASRNFFGRSTPESQAYAELERGITRITNESLRLNKGVQTEGDAQRAAKEVIAAFGKNDTALMTKALQDLQRINLRAAESKAQMIDRRRKSQGVEPAFGGQTATTSPPPNADNTDPLGIRRK